MKSNITTRLADLEKKVQDQSEQLRGQAAEFAKRNRLRRIRFVILAALLPLSLYAATAIPNTFSEGETLSAAKLNDNFKALATADLPTGTIVAFGGQTVPEGWLLCDGSLISRSTRATLFAAIGTAYGTGDGSTTFHLPDFRGRFLRGLNSGTGRDPDSATRTAMNSGGNTGDTVGSLQGHQFNSHRHQYARGETGGGVYCGDPSTHGLQCLGSAQTFQYTTGGGSFVIGLEGGNETRPVNAYVNWIIKH